MRLIYWLLGFDDPGRITQTTEWEWYAASAVETWLVVVVAVAALLAVAINFLPHTPLPWVKRVFLGVVRLAGFALLLAMLCQLEWRITIQRQLKPKIAVVTDTSGSMSLEDVDGASRLAAARRFVRQQLDQLADDADLVHYSIDWKLHRDEKSEDARGMTRLYHSLGELVQSEYGLQSIVLLTDGNDTAGDQGTLAASMIAERPVAVYPVVFGKTEAPAMPTISLTEGGAYVRLHDELRLSATLRGQGLKPQVVAVRLYEDERKEPIASKENVRIGEKPTSVTFTIKPDKTGKHVYRIEMEGVRDAVTRRAQVAEHHVEVIDAKIRVLYLDIPRDERKILAHWLGQDPVVDLATLTLMPKGGWFAAGQLRHKNVGDGLPNDEADMYEYDVIIFGDIPRAYFRQDGDVSETKMQRLVDFVRRRGGGLITVGGRSVYAAGGYQDSQLADILPVVIEPTRKPQIPGKFKLQPTPVGLGHPILRFDADSDRNRDIVFDLPTLDGCNRLGAVKPGAILLAERVLSEGESKTGLQPVSLQAGEKSGPVENRSYQSVPLMAVQNVGKGRVLSLAMDTTWRWEMLRDKDSDDQFRRFWGRAIRSLAPDPRIAPRQPQILNYQSQVTVGRQMKMATRLVDKFFRPVRNADIEVTVTSPSGRSTLIYPQDGRQAPGLYVYEFSVDRAGEWIVTTRYNNEETVGRFEAGESQDEFTDPRAMPELMQQLAEATGGRMIRADQPATKLIDQLKLQPHTISETAAVPVWNLHATMVLLILLVGIDCYVRKKRGMV